MTFDGLWDSILDVGRDSATNVDKPCNVMPSCETSSLSRRASDFNSSSLVNSPIKADCNSAAFN